ncbi:hypothetical protein M3J09_001104 [Ascochyta lentis]
MVNRVQPSNPWNKKPPEIRLSSLLSHRPPADPAPQRNTIRSCREYNTQCRYGINKHHRHQIPESAGLFRCTKSSVLTMSFSFCTSKAVVLYRLDRLIETGGSISTPEPTRTVTCP